MLAHADVGEEDRGEAAGHCLGDSGLAQGVEEACVRLAPIPETTDREARVERKTGLCFELRLFQLAEIRQRRREEEMRQRDCSIVFDGTATGLARLG